VVGINLDAAFHVAKESFSLMKEQSPQVRNAAYMCDSLSLKVPCSYQLTAMGKLALLRYLSEF